MHLSSAQVEAIKREAGLFTGARVDDTQRASEKYYRLVWRRAVDL